MWQGVPFKLLSGNVLESTSIAISKIPHIVVETSSDWFTPLLTVSGALIAGSIPAWVAIKAIRANKEQMLHQQLVINKQKFIDEFRIKMSVFLADAENLTLVINRDIHFNGISFLDLPPEQQNLIADITHRLDINYNYIELMIGSDEKFSEIIKIMDAILAGVLKLLDTKGAYTINLHAGLLRHETIKCLDAEWKSVMPTFK